jgi:phage shock protein E
MRLSGKARFFLLLGLLLTMLACSHSETVRNLKLNHQDLLIDVRTPGEFDRGHLAGALNIPYTEIDKRIGDYAQNKQSRIVVYCRSGRRSAIARDTLVKMGYSQVINAGSYSELKELGLQRPGK